VIRETPFATATILLTGNFTLLDQADLPESTVLLIDVQPVFKLAMAGQSF
jgi:hypothetical protein